MSILRATLAPLMESPASRPLVLLLKVDVAQEIRPAGADLASTRFIRTMALLPD